eukprot:SAG31_NODE_13001_length_900_cov_1.458177_1_plen_177_part_00
MTIINWLGALVCMSVGYQTKCSPVTAVEKPGFVRVSTEICAVCKGDRGWRHKQYYISGPASAVEVAGEWSQEGERITHASAESWVLTKPIVAVEWSNLPHLQVNCECEAEGQLTVAVIVNGTDVLSSVPVEGPHGCSADTVIAWRSRHISTGNATIALRFHLKGNINLFSYRLVAT